MFILGDISEQGSVGALKTQLHCFKCSLPTKGEMGV